MLSSDDNTLKRNVDQLQSVRTSFGYPRIHYFPADTNVHRPALFHVSSQSTALSIGAGGSFNHIDAYYDQLDKNKLPFPTYTVLTTSDLNHALGNRWISGCSIASGKTNAKLKAMADSVNGNTEKITDIINRNKFLEQSYSLKNSSVRTHLFIIKPADIEFEKEITIRLDNEITVKIMSVESPFRENSSIVLIPERKILFLGDAIDLDSRKIRSNTIDRRKLECFLEQLNLLDFNLSFQSFDNNIFTKEDLLNEVHDIFFT